MFGAKVQNNQANSYFELQQCEKMGDFLNKIRPLQWTVWSEHFFQNQKLPVHVEYPGSILP